LNADELPITFTPENFPEIAPDDTMLGSDIYSDENSDMDLRAAIDPRFVLLSADK
jgi:hypothetical protein